MKNQIESDTYIPNILIVDDVPANLKLLSDILKCEGYKTRPVPSGELALLAAESEKPDLILLDIMMPGIDGFEVCRQLKENPGLKDIPVIFISTLGDTFSIVKALATGGVDYINKPFQAEEVKARVNTHLRLYQQTKELQGLNATKDKFFSIIAHDLRGPFNGFLGLTQVLAENLSDFTMPQLQDMLYAMKNSASNLYNLIVNLLEWSRIQRGLVTISPETFPLLPKISEILSITREALSAKEIKVSLDIPSNLLLFADINMFGSIMRNLITNAVKFTPKGGSIVVSAQPNSTNSIRISVKDTGIGMSSDLLGKLFRLDGNTSRKGTEGELSTGLGLILCKDFIEKHGGEIWATSEEDKGSVFSFTISGSYAQIQEEVIQNTIPDSIKTHQVNNLKILIAEDDYASDKLISVLSRQFSSNILNARTGIEAVETCRNNPDIDLVFMDIKMPLMDGYEATRQIRLYNTDVIIIAQTANDYPEARVKAMKAGCNYYITKPIDKEILINLIQKHFGN